MISLFQIKNIILGPASRSTGHETYLHAIYQPPNESNSAYKIIYKKNKCGKPNLSRLEVMFSHLARLFLSPYATSIPNLVVNHNHKVTGLAVQHLCYEIAKKEGLKHRFYALKNPKTGFVFKASNSSDPTKIPIYFLDKLPQGFFSKLVKAEEDGLLTLDYTSLASLLATSYTLEEDDLHKGNFGFYLSGREEKPHAVFFKIDHDLMFIDSIMGYTTKSFFHLFDGAHTFDIIDKDLQTLPRLNHSKNAYWPSQFNYIPTSFTYNKEYHNLEESIAFARLSENSAFTKAKWNFFLKYILMPDELIAETLRECVDRSNASERALAALVIQATLSRLARLRAVLFSVKEFREYVGTLSIEDTQALTQEMLLPYEGKKLLIHQVSQSISRYQELCQSENGFTEGDTPLHTAIKLGDYRYEDTLNLCDRFINVKNKMGKTPFDVSLERIGSQSEDALDARKNFCFIAKHLLENGANETTKYKESGFDSTVKSYQFKNPYLEGITARLHYYQFRNLLRDIGEDDRFCLKSKKRLAIECIKRFIEVNAHHSHFKSRLTQLENDINGHSSEEKSAGVKYIRQLRTKLWIIRQFRGLYGFTSTQGEINSLIHKAKEQIKVKEPSCFSFFSYNQKGLNSSYVPVDEEKDWQIYGRMN